MARARFDGDKHDDPTPGDDRCPYCDDPECDRHHPENDGFLCVRGEGSADEEPRPICPYCLDKDCGSPPSEDAGPCPLSW